MNGVSDWCGLTLPVNCLSVSLVSFVQVRNMANSVESDVVSFDSALEESLKRLCELGMSRELRTEQKDAISILISGKDLLAVLPTGFGKSLMFT